MLYRIQNKETGLYLAKGWPKQVWTKHGQTFVKESAVKDVYEIITERLPTDIRVPHEKIEIVCCEENFVRTEEFDEWIEHLTEKR